MDWPNVNWKFFELLQQEHVEQYGGAQLVVVGSCGLHHLHNAFKCCFSKWQLDKPLKATHTLFHNVPARREDYSAVTKTTFFPLSLCGHHWIENLPVVERAPVVWPSLLQYMDAVRTKKHNCSSLEGSTCLGQIAVLHGSCQDLQSFLEPVMPFLCQDLAELIMSLLRRFIKRAPPGHHYTAADQTGQFRRDCMQALSDIVMPFSNSLRHSCPLRAEVTSFSPSRQCRGGWTSSSVISSASPILSSGLFARSCYSCPMVKPLWREAFLSTRRLLTPSLVCLFHLGDRQLLPDCLHLVLITRCI
ncbi:uncharacterized protein LOC133961514 [Platichthys flesus]|uniref:uncharacterized protein LOC133961514 n=1 Tax=Platichthys flesus TaxID=8260 RepID=UPI002DBCB058|nr:uncharacterized protein LOC133961514 [Platichthys flesus]